MITSVGATGLPENSDSITFKPARPPSEAAANIYRPP